MVIRYLISTDGFFVPIPLGTTSLGRGPLLGIQDKKLSRHQAKITLSDDGTLSLVFTGLNPMHLTKHGQDTKTLMQKGQGYVVQHGDSFSLIPDKYIFRISNDMEGIAKHILNNEGWTQSKPKNDTLDDPIMSFACSPTKSKQRPEDLIESIESFSESPPNILKNPKKRKSEEALESQSPKKIPKLDPEASVPQCDHGLKCFVKTVIKDSPTKGKSYYGCPKNGEERCPYFQWLGAPKCLHDQPCIRRVVKKPGPNNGRHFWTCGDPIQPCKLFKWIRDE